MDPKKQNDYFNSKSEYASKVYRIGGGNGSMDGVRSIGPYIADNCVQLSADKKICDCSSTHSSEKMCTECQPTAVAASASATATATATSRHLMENQRWSTEPMQRAYISINAQNVVKPNTNAIYVQPSNSSRPYWTHSKAAPLVDESLVKCNHPYGLQQSQHLHLATPPSANVVLESYKDGGVYAYDSHPYVSKEELTPKITYALASASKARPTVATAAAAICSIDMRNKSLDGLHGKPDHVVNPVNDLSLKEPDLSPNYARKCPQIFSAAVSEHSEAHVNLYMTPPHFSSDKFAMTNLNEPTTPKRQPGMRSGGYNYNTATKITTEESKVAAAPVVAADTYLPQHPYQQHGMKKAPHQQQPLQHNYYPNHTNYYEPIPAKVTAPNLMSPAHQQHQAPADLYQYSKGHMSVITAPGRDEVSPYVKKEQDIHYDEADYSKQHSHTYAYGGPSPAAAPPPQPLGSAETTHIKKESSPFTTSMPEPPLHGYPRFASYEPLKVVDPAITTTSQAPPLASRDAVCYYTHQNASLIPPASAHHIAVEMSSKMLPQRIPAQQNSVAAPAYAPPEPTHLQYNTLKQQQAPVHVVKSLSDTTLMNHTGPPPVICYTMGTDSHSLPPLASPLATPPYSVPPLPPTSTSSFMATKKTQAPKPNYRELINQVYARRNATSEQELNMQIIKKTLNVEQIAHGGMRSTPEASIALPVPLLDVKPMPNQLQLLSQPSPNPLLPHIEYAKSHDSGLNGALKLEEKPSSSSVLSCGNNNSPLDLSMRTVKTCADSTEYKYKPLPAASVKSEYKPTALNALPRVDFQPNFAFSSNSSGSSAPLATTPKSSAAKHMLLERHNESHSPSIRHASNTAPPPLANTFCGTTGSAVAHTPIKSGEHSKPPQPIVGAISYNGNNSNSILAHRGGAVATVLTAAAAPIDVKPDTSVIKSEPVTVLQRVALKQDVPSETITKPPSSLGVVPPAPTAIATVAPTAAVEQPQSAYITEFLRNPRFLGKKRHLREYSNQKYAEFSSAKQSRLGSDTVSSDAPNHINHVHSSVDGNTGKVSVATLVAHAVEKAIQSESPRPQRVPEAAKVSIPPSPSPSAAVPAVAVATAAAAAAVLPLLPLKMEMKVDSSLLIASRIRTKAELKGFTFHAAPPALPSPVLPMETTKLTALTMPPKTSQEPPSEIIKDEEQIVSNEKCSVLADLKEEFNESSLLDFSWRRTCNSFVEQLLTNTNATNSTAAVNPKQPEKLLPCCEKLPSAKKADAANAVIVPAAVDGVIVVQAKTVIQKKHVRIDRDRLRMQQEQRLAARLQGGSSSETDNELDKQKTERLKRPNIKAKSRQTAVASHSSKSHFSDCGSDSSSSCGGVQNNLFKLRKQQKSKTTTTVTAAASPPAAAAVAERNQPGKKCKVKRVEDSSDDDDGRQELKQKINAAANVVRTKVGETVLPNSTKSSQPQQQQQTSHTAKKSSLMAKTNCRSNSKTKEKKQKSAHTKVALNTMTRSKRKRELELQLANSKVLRNEKIIRNSTAKIKRKYVRKFVASNQNGGTAANKDSSSSLSSTNDNGGSSQQIIVTRLRSAKVNNKTTTSLASSQVGKKRQAVVVKKLGSNKKSGGARTKTIKNGSDGQQADSILEFYRYKRALKIPPSLISIRRLTNHKIAESLPDLETKQREFELADFRKQCGKSLLQADSGALNTKRSEEPKSIIDVLHSRVVSGGSVKYSATSHANGSGNKTSPGGGAGARFVGNHRAKLNGPTALPAILKHSDAEKKYHNGDNADENDDDDMDDKDDNDEKKHFSIFETKVLQTKTRTESKMQQRREIIREIFVGNDRPASAPPEMTQQPAEGLSASADVSSAGGGGASNEAMTYEQKFEQFLRQMNEENIRNFGRPLHLRNVATNASTGTSTPNTTVVKLEEDTESASAIDTEDKSIDCNESLLSVTAAEAANQCAVMPSNAVLKRRRPAKYLRRKGSSGFDYLRKKKRSSNANATAAGSVNACSGGGKSERGDDDYKYKVKTESDVCREIQKWVLNKGVGQSTMHKAARLGYIDVIVYCLDRMGMNPDQKDNAGYTPLHEACTNGWLDIARLLLMYGANHSEAALSGIRPLHEASENDHEEIVRLLLSYGADPLLATYSDQTPLMMASSPVMRDLINNHLSDVQSVGSNRKPWRFNGPWEIIESSECGFNIFKDAPGLICDMSSALRKRSVSSLITRKNLFKQCEEEKDKPIVEATTKADKIMNKTVNDNKTTESTDIVEMNAVCMLSDKDPLKYSFNNSSDNDGEIFEFEEADVLLPPLYLLKDEGTDQWVLLSDLCNLLKVKSKDTLLNKIFPSSSMSVAHKSLMRELKMSDFLEKATCLQLLCAGEKFNVCASKVVLIKYNESVKNLLGVKTILMKF